MPSPAVSAALEYHARGWRVIPLQPRTKRPIHNAWQNSEYSEPELIQIFDAEPTPNIGVILGHDGLIDVDLDCAEAQQLAPFFLPRTEAVFGRRSRRRTHWIYKVADPVRYRKFSDPRRHGVDEEGVIVEIRSTAHQTMLPPSWHPDGDQIEWDTHGDPAEIVSGDLVEAVGRLAACSLLARYWPGGDRHHAALYLAGGLLRSGWTLEAAESLVEAVARTARDNEIDDRLRAVRDTAARIESGESVAGWPLLSEILGEDVLREVRRWLDTEGSGQNLPLTDEGNAERLIFHYGQNVRYCPQTGRWYIWDGRHWAEDIGEQIVQLAGDTTRRILDEAARETNDDRRTALAKWSVSSQNVNRQLAMVRLAKTKPAIQIAAETLDGDPWLLTCLNGTLNLRTGGLQPYSREDYITKMAGFSYDAQARCPRWEAFLHEIMGGSQELVDFLQRAVGYSMCGSGREQKAFMTYGTGANGKTTFLEVVRWMLGGYARNAEFSTFLQKQSDSVRSDIARLRGARFVTASEAEEGRRLAPALIKQITGGETITARFLYQSEFEYRPVMKLWMATNHRPVVRDSSHGFWRRICIVPFTVTIPPERQDRDLTNHLREELAGVAAWAVRGCQMWIDGGLGDTPETLEATERYREDMDVISDFLQEVCVISEGQRVRSSDLYRAYSGWCRNQGERPLRNAAFKTKIEEKGFDYRPMNGYPTWFGIGLRITSDSLVLEEDGSAEIGHAPAPFGMP